MLLDMICLMIIAKTTQKNGCTVFPLFIAQYIHPQR